MTRLHRRDRTALVLLGLTAAGVALTGSSAGTYAVGALLALIAAFKGRLVVLDYFGFRGAPGPWRAILTAWIAVVTIAAVASPLAGFIR